ncbi:MAG: hypothetical protein LPK38_08660 [Actinomycetes bacterium]|nr:hypothetical protein [Actinomycetes bacterium]MDX5381339.1 hypothetical protein [Actinomycetes bacterium]MDX5400739.1 hypothetical protein [Actinomycetes bacterium]MDX5451115.1 hypothetical protein [Actinomycetes bacterium]
MAATTSDIVGTTTRARTRALREDAGEEQPEFVVEHHETTGTLPAVRTED